jgi:CheY-like chemotaxis protein
MNSNGLSAPVLVVDDDFDIRESLQEVLDNEGYQVLVAADGVEALQVLEQLTSPVVVITDHMMPRLDGPGLIDMLLDQPLLADRTQFLYMTAGDRRLAPTFVTRLQELSVRIMRKPFDIDELTRCVADAQEQLLARVPSGQREGKSNRGDA